MPVPIKYISDHRGESNLGIDYSFLFATPPPLKKVIASNKDASILFEIWGKGEKIDENTIKVPFIQDVTANDILRLKSMGFLTGDLNIVKFTRKGKIVVSTMALGETSQFEKNKQSKSYAEIMASMNKRGKKGFRMASSDQTFSINTSNNLNLGNIFRK